MTLSPLAPDHATLVSDAIYEDYGLQAIRIAGAQAHPTPLVQSAAMASVAPPKPSYDIPKNEDGSIDIWFGPSKPQDVADAAFIQTVPGRDFIAALRLYGARAEFYDQTWKPDDIVKVE